MNNFNPWTLAIPILIIVAFLWVSPKSFLSVNPKWIFSEKDTTFAKIDSIAIVYGMRGRGFNQRVYYSFSYKNQIYDANYKATAINSGSMKVKDKVKVEFLKNEPSYHKIIGYIKNNQHLEKIKNSNLQSY
ncbi:MAG: hypothetical protein CMC96_02365 [Flavobacteriales bacterium]|nr:hypothetical protein [Flavobacteriales bacterium]|tara:strand:+ start:35296 stop:35688 length:393 start_codon:yes stop_codon:yes gene_type:complete